MDCSLCKCWKGKTLWKFCSCTYSKRKWKFKGNKNIINIYRIQAFDSIMYGYFPLDLLISCKKVKSLLDLLNLFSPTQYKKITK